MIKKFSSRETTNHISACFYLSTWINDRQIILGTVCASENSHQFCPTSGESGSPLMVQNEKMRFEAESVTGSVSMICQDTG